MNKFVRQPNLPLKCSGLIICSRYYHIFKNKLESLGLRIFLMPDNFMLPHAVSYHTDLSVFHAGNDRLFISKSFSGSNFYKQLRSEGFKIDFFYNDQKDQYPYDAGGNVCYFSKRYFMNKTAADPSIINYLACTDAERIDVKQGYTKCSICIVNDNSIITGDRKIAEISVDRGLDVLFSDPSYINLNGFEHGFIGGSTFKIASDRLCFTGVLDRFPEEEKYNILAFCDKKGIEPVWLSDMPLFDIGGAVPVLEF